MSIHVNAVPDNMIKQGGTQEQPCMFRLTGDSKLPGDERVRADGLWMPSSTAEVLI